MLNNLRRGGNHLMKKLKILDFSSYFLIAIWLSSGSACPALAPPTSIPRLNSFSPSFTYLSPTTLMSWGGRRCPVPFVCPELSTQMEILKPYSHFLVLPMLITFQAQPRLEKKQQTERNNGAFFHQWGYLN